MQLGSLEPAPVAERLVALADPETLVVLAEPGRLVVLVALAEPAELDVAHLQVVAGCPAHH